MRDALLLILVVGAVPFIIWRPPIGVLLWSWLGYMNPHRFAWGFAYGFPFSQLVALATLAGFVVYRDRGKVPITPLTVALLVFVAWMTLSTVFSLHPDDSWQEWDRTMKIQLFTFLTIMLMQKQEWTKLLIWVIALSLGFFGFKGGIFAVLTAGNYRVWGPPESFIEDNNALALALLMAVPLMRFCQLQTPQKLAKMAWTAGIGLTGIAILASHSRGALVGAILTLLYAWWKSGKKLFGLLAVIPLIPFVFAFMPEQWFERMSTITEYEEDASAMGRINAWWFAFNLAMDRPLLGGGFQAFQPDLFLDYAPDPDAFHDAHSIYFEVLAEHGFIGLALFLIIGVLVLRQTGKLAKLEFVSEEQNWIPQLASMLRISFVSYATTGAFLGLAYFDLYYQLVAVTVVLTIVAAQYRTAPRSADIGHAGVGPASQAEQTDDGSLPAGAHGRSRS